MVAPIDFCYNHQTAHDNEFMNNVGDSRAIKQNAIEEFNAAVVELQKKQINVIVFDKSEFGDLDQDHTPDAVFPNNWISTQSNGTVILYPMFAQNRNLEKNCFRFVLEDLMANFKVSKVINFRS